MKTAMVTTIIGAILGTALCLWLAWQGLQWAVNFWANGGGWQ